MSEQPPQLFCEPSKLVQGWIEKVRVDVEYTFVKPQEVSWTLFDDHHNPIIDSVEEGSVTQEGVLVSTYVDIFQAGKYIFETNNFRGKRSSSMGVIKRYFVLIM